MPSSTELMLSTPSITLSYPNPPTRARFSCSFSTPRRMAAPSRPASSLNSSFNRLSSELLVLIFEQLRDIDTRSVLSVRLISKRFDAIATPTAYRFLTLNEHLVAPDAEQQYPNVFDHISLHTNHVVVPSNLDPDGISRVLSCIRRLSSIRWQYIDSDIHAAGMWLPSDLLSSNDSKFRDTKLHVEDLPMRNFDSNLGDVFTKAIPAKHLTTLRLANPTPALSTRLSSLKSLLVQASQIRTFHYEDRGQGTCFNFLPRDRMPAFTNLRLRSYDWNHAAEDVRKHWDFSRIESLELVSVPVFHFLRSVSFKDFAKLHSLQVEDYSAHLPDKREDATAGLYLLIKNHIRALEVLDITCHTKLFPLDAIMKHQRSLRVFRFRDHTGFSEDDERCPTLLPNDLAMLSQRLQSVHTLELDMDVRMCNATAFLRAVCAFPALHTLTLHVQTVVQPFEDIAPGNDYDYEAAMETFRLLIQGKHAMNSSASWKQITINVGGWRRVMVRRLSSAWRRQNEMGIYAERCFVLENDAWTGNIAVREEMCVENTSRGGSPIP
ncbi:hypothetical protein NCS57_00445500 [Fusarium keratoplasticum]|uniref:Uncharacterized protein n=1 Tax=Fusarium keratoplasticum TaxID=1328300 RepID=A0ACC0R5D9_9HYPO|nr:hypothetical protein NCS57_00445500 [Fusarium keratoplasticum]KAI8675443.1 hypothetical protein NCS57_00445500 [Fusarium keratoplasticum]KAI8681889.1 hypothetical protein NCS55_00442200 [Fusarium keratoplasticum]